jgi:hypothetical protein
MLGINDLFQYKDFIQQCPGINHYIRFASSNTTKSWFDYGIYDYSNLTDNTAEITNRDNPSTPTKDIPTKTSAVPSVTPRTTNQETNISDQQNQSPTITDAQPLMLPPFTQLSDETEESYSFVDNMNEDPNGTPRQNNATRTQSMMTRSNIDTSTLGTMDTVGLPKNITLPNNDDTTGFNAVHYRLYASVTIWMQSENANRNSFYVKWQ